MTNEITITREEFMKVSARVSSRIVDSLAKEAEKEDELPEVSAEEGR